MSFRKNWRMLLAPMPLLALLGIALLLARDNQPKFQGRSLGEWLVDIENARDDNAAAPGRNAVRQIGTNAIPSLLRLMQAQDSRLKETLIILLRKQHIFRIQVADAASAHLRAMIGFEALGSEANSAIPDLQRMMNEPRIVRFTAGALVSIGPAGVEAAVIGLADTNAVVRRETAGVLGTPGIVRFTTNATPARMAVLRAQAEFAVPPLIRALNDSDELTRARAAIALGLLGQKPEIAVPALVKNLLITNSWRVPASAAKALGRFGTNAASALPVLKEIAAHPDSHVRETVAAAIQSIESQSESTAE